jgi:hypothetical protein
MKRLTCLFAFSLLVSALHAQDEGAIEKRERFERDKGVFIGLGPSFTLGKNIGDYSVGFNIEAGFLKRVNRVLSVGPSISYIGFDYDPEKTGFNNAFISEYYQDGLYVADIGMIIDFEGGNMSLLSLAYNLKLNFVPVKDNSKISIYGFAKPFLTYASRSAVEGVASIYSNNYDPDQWYFEGEVPWVANDPNWAEFGIEISDKLKSTNTVSGGIFIGPGIEIMPAKKVSVYAQVAFGYTFPVSFVSTESYEGNTFDVLTEEFPIVSKGFPSVNVQFGASFNF